MIVFVLIIFFPFQNENNEKADDQTTRTRKIVRLRTKHLRKTRNRSLDS